MTTYTQTITILSMVIISEWGDLSWHSNKVRMKVTVVMSDHPAVVNTAMFFPDIAIQIGDTIITTDSE